MNEALETASIAALNNIYDVFGMSCTYGATDIMILIDTKAASLEQVPTVIFSSLTVRIKKSDIAQPAVGDTVVLSGANYVVMDEPTGTQWEWTVELSLDGTP
jgi:hypothetical protein